MAEPLDPEFYLELFSTVFFAGTIGIMIWEAYRQKIDFRAQIEGLRKESYEIIRNDHVELSKLLLGNETLRKVWQLDGSDRDIELTPDEEKQISEYYLLHLDLYERLLSLMMKKDSPVPYHEWQMWLSWFQRIANRKLLEKTFKEFKHIFDPELVREINENIFAEPKCKNCKKSFKNMKEIVEHIEENDNCYQYQEQAFQERAKEILDEREVQ